jgi:hypothetical protein
MEVWLGRRRRLARKRVDGYGGEEVGCDESLVRGDCYFEKQNNLAANIAYSKLVRTQHDTRPHSILFNNKAANPFQTTRVGFSASNGKITRSRSR